ncbi:MAG: hypothetical protein A3J55_04280 [Candidatus Ryanbacteria bacterium RIFCSPHIGHO2_02_FULL_45_17b]|uniref:Uncharacterized protein n=1 Tax=Candidatus Ryanbacteria bacterium RIFCSPHIGHO2_01_FULL_45_22 TaxID=1802114 RepID=A0A1G2G2T0_9BACT|nr:MAG: hypothetical protein A2719_02415 [Candidatus Ryanbacteria bacterium RIFCSPHIGHO2_01_FULL_45_22]OGZ46489.1 MAG: hypothetical protein A3J55_04280 [Candidatus Ryanbacteria bacterium RIFCSPHIGHO2_02_FULL_45_17b]
MRGARGGSELNRALRESPPSIRAVWRGFNTDLVLRKLFSREKDFAKPRLIFPARRKGFGE